MCSIDKIHRNQVIEIEITVNITVEVLCNMCGITDIILFLLFNITIVPQCLANTCTTPIADDRCILCTNYELICYKDGDMSEMIKHHSNIKSETFNYQQRFSIEFSSNITSCFIDIFYFNITKQTLEIEDRVYVNENGGICSEKSSWNIKKAHYQYWFNLVYEGTGKNILTF